MESINYQAKVIELTAKLDKVKKTRADKGKSRAKYDSLLPKQYKEYLKRANRKGMEFKLSVEEFETLCNSLCIYCSLPATGVDRVESNKGYTISNSQPCCGTCNMMKRMMSDLQFIEHCQRIVTVYQQRKET